jgi:hypothetical protein
MTGHVALFVAALVAAMATALGFPATTAVEGSPARVGPPLPTWHVAIGHSPTATSTSR